MKYLLFFALMANTAAFAMSAPTIYKCDLSVAQPGKSPLVMSGNIIPDDAKTADTAGTYLTLAPLETSRIPLEARILFTYWTDGPNGAYWYNPITLHKPGQSASPVASTEITLGQGATLSYTDDLGVSYSVNCAPRP